MSLAALAGCDSADETPERGPAVSYSIREPRSNVLPTHDASFRLMRLAGEQRLLGLQKHIVEAGEKCAFATAAILKDGFEGTDAWRVTCTDTGDWLVTFRPHAGRLVERCSDPNVRSSCYYKPRDTQLTPP